MSIPTKQPSLSGEIQFFDNYIPVLHEGDYKITVTQKLKGAGGANGFDVDQSFTEKQSFTIAGPRFSLDPVDIHREFPPPGHQGRFETVLPHMTLTKRALPWERNVFSDAAIPWLALLVFSEDEILEPVIGTGVNPGVKPNPTRSSSIRLEQLTNPPTKPSVVYPDVTFDPYEKPATTLCSVIDIAPDTFNKIVPSESELAYLAHGRKVNIEKKSTSVTVGGSGTRVEDATQWFSVIVAGRFPDAPVGARATATKNGVKSTGKNIAHLVSLEGLTKYIPATPGKKATDFPTGTERVRLVSLASWTFTCLPVSGQSFSALMEGLVPDSDGDRDELLLRVPVPTSPAASTLTQTYALDALESGYTARTYATRQGEDTFAWYRGPFVLKLPERFPANRTQYSVSGQAVVYDKDKGLFDLSYASAFEIGRLAAIHSSVLTSNLHSWRSKGRQLLDRLQQRMSSSAIASLFDTASGELEAEAALQHAMLTESFINYLTGKFVSSILPAVQGANASAPAGVGDIRPANQSAANDAQKLASALADPKIASFLQTIDYEELDPILTFLADLYLLHGVPFDYLVPDERMLPAESVRFFYVDRNWLDVLVEGAMSVGLHTGIDVGFQTAMNTVISSGLYELIHAVRDRLLGIKTPSLKDAGDITLGGVLIRSAVVSGWPGIEIDAKDASGNKISLLRMDHVGPEVLLCLFAGVPASISVSEPQEGLHFGVESNDAVYLRHL
ncbi:MAG: hypothetical protein JKY45_09495, partial [Emcibacter sp.]|nr:hypothetical protein [Emcibacter sp.]